MANYPTNSPNLPSAWQAKYQAKKLLKDATNPELQLEQGNQFLSQNKLIEAIACYRRVLKLVPNHPQAHQQLGHALKQQGNLSEANLHYRQAIDAQRASIQPKLNPDNYQAIAQIYLKQAQSFEVQGEWQRAIAACQEALKFSPQLASAYKTWGDCLQKSGKITESMGYYAQALAIQPHFPEVCLNLGSLYFKQQQWQLAIDFYQQAIALDVQCVEAYRNLARVYKKLNQSQLMLNCWFKAAQLAPNQVNAIEHCRLAEIMREAGDPERAIACYQQALKLQPNLADIYLKLGALLTEQNQLQGTIRLYRQGLKYFPGNSSLNFRLAQILEQQNNPDAIVYYQQVIKTKPQDWQAYFNLANIFARQQQYDAAIDYYQKVLQLNPQYLATYPKLTESQLQQQQWSGIIRTCQQGLNLDSQQEQLYNYLGQALLQLEKYDVAIKVYGCCLKLNPEATENYHHLGTALIAEQRWSEAIKCYQQILKQEPDSLESHRKIGEAATQTGQWSLSAIAWSKVIKIQGDEPWAYHHLGMALSNLEKWTEAAQALKHSIRLNPDFPWSYYHLGEVLAELQQWSESSAAYRKFLTQENHAYAYDRLGDNLVKQIQPLSESAKTLHQEACQCFYRAIEVEPDYLPPYYKLMELKPYDEEICFMLAETYARDEKWSTAVIFYQIGLGINADSPQAHFELAMVLEQQQQLPQAIAHYQSAVRLNPEESIYQSHLTEILNQEKMRQIGC